MVNYINGYPDMLEAHYLDNPWKMLVSCILLNRTKRAQVDAVIDELFRLWPTPERMARALPDEVAFMIRSLGFQNRRSRCLVRMSCDYAADLSAKKPWEIELKDVEALHGIGTFALEAFRIFFLDEIDFEPTDVELAEYVAWRQTIKKDWSWQSRIDARDVLVRIEAMRDRIRRITGTDVGADRRWRYHGIKLELSLNRRIA
jgi:hypothetical protein